jgi:hypothetical protein
MTTLRSPFATALASWVRMNAARFRGPGLFLSEKTGGLPFPLCYLSVRSTQV